MSVQAMSWAFDQKIPPTRKIVLLAIANCADVDGDNAYPGQERLAIDTSMSVRSVARHLEWLEKHRYLIRRRRRRPDGYKTSDRYILGCNPDFEPEPATNGTGRALPDKLSPDTDDNLT